MPHVVYIAPFLLCPWPGCDYRIEMIDFNLETRGDPVVYNRVIAAWFQEAEYAVVARCPGCSRFVRFAKARKDTVQDLPPADAEVLPDDWHTVAFIA